MGDRIMKTAITVLQELMVKFGEVPEYECVAQSGPQHQAVFEYRCGARGQVSKAVARSKKDAKQEAARAMLLIFAAKGIATVPPPYALPGAPSAVLPRDPPEAPCETVAKEGGGATVDVRSYVALVRELCEEYKLPAVEYELVGDTGPPHMRQFTIRASIDRHTRLATASTKKAARQLASEALYHYLRENLKLTHDFSVEEALARAHEKAMERYRETRPGHAQRPDLTQRPADFHLGLQQQFEEDMRSMALQAAEKGGEEALGRALVALGLDCTWELLEREHARPLHVVVIGRSAPPLAFAGDTRDAAADDTLAYLRLTLPTFPSLSTFASTA